jgi:hypothetical protein
MVGNTTCDKRLGILYKPRRLPDRHLAVFPQIASIPLSSSPPPLVAAPVPDAPLFSDAPCRSSPTHRAAPPRHTRSAVFRRWRARPRRRPPTPMRISVPDVAALPDSPPPALIPPRRRPRPTLLLGSGLLQPVCRADASASRTPPRPPAGVRVPDGRLGRAGFCLADVSP